MGTGYKIYGNNGAGGPIDWTTPLSSTTGLSFVTAALAASSQSRFGVRAYDTVSGLVEQSVDSQVTINLDASQNDITGLPPAPVGLGCVPLASGGYRVSWHWPFPQVRPTGWKVYLGTPTPNYSSPVATVPFTGQAAYRFDGTGLTGGTTYQVGVRAYNAVGTETNTIVASVLADSAAPANLDALTATVGT